MKPTGVSRTPEREKVTPRLGVELTKKGYYREAYRVFAENDAFERKPVYMGCYALVVAAIEHDFISAEKYCQTALLLEEKNPIIHLCLGRIYKLSKRTDLALKTFKNGLRYAKNSRELLREIDTYDMWRSPIIPFLSRENFINRGLLAIIKLLKRDVIECLVDLTGVKVSVW